jgi:hypothetical protein
MQNNHETRDFYLAAYLVAVGIKLQSHSKINGSTVFSFTNESRSQEAIEAYYSMSSSVEPITYSNTIKSLKSIVHSYDKNTDTNSQGINYVQQFKGTARV